MLKRAQRKNFIRKCSNNDDSIQKPDNKPLYKPQAYNLNKFDIVWAKITGYPWWPAIVTTLPGQKDSFRKEELNKSRRPLQKFNSMSRGEYRVDFIADQTHAFLKKKFLLTFQQHREKLSHQGLQFSRRKRRFFQMALDQADQLYQVLQLSKTQVNRPSIIQNKVYNENRFSLQSESQQNQKLMAQNRSQKEEFQPQDKKIEGQSSQNLSQSEDLEQRKQRKPLLKIIKRVKTTNFKKQSRIKSENLDKQEQKQRQIVQVSEKKNAKFSVKRQLRRLSFIKTKPKEKKYSQQSVRDQIQSKTKNQNFPLSDKQIFYQEDKQIIEPIIQKQPQNILNLPHRNDLSFQNTQILNPQKSKPLPLHPDQTLMMHLLQKYKLHTIDEVEAEYQKHLETSFVNTKNHLRLKGNMFFVKSIFSTFGKRKFIKKQENQNNETKFFTETLIGPNKIRQSYPQNIEPQKKILLIQYCRKWMARKIYKIVAGILRNKNVFKLDEKVVQQIRQRCKNIAFAIFLDDEDQDFQRERKLISQQNKKKGCCNYATLKFVQSLKNRIEQSVRFLRFYCLQNWDLLVKIGNFNPQICILVRSFEQFLQRQCGVVMKNEEKLEEIVKQIGVQNQKTQITCGHITTEMEVQNESTNNLAHKFPHQKLPEFQNNPTDSKQQYVEFN